MVGAPGCSTVHWTLGSTDTPSADNSSDSYTEDNRPIPRARRRRMVWLRLLPHLGIVSINMGQSIQVLSPEIILLDLHVHFRAGESHLR